MSNSFNPLEELITPPASPNIPVFKWATVITTNYNTGALEILIDNDEAPITIDQPSTLTSPPTEGNRVFIVRFGSRLVILGVADGYGNLPVGVMIPYTGPEDEILLPLGWIFPKGQAINRETYSRYFNLVGTIYGSGNGSTTFNVPDIRGRSPIGYNGADSDFNSVGKKTGSKTHTLTAAQLPNLTAQADGNHTHGGSTGNAGSHNHGGTTGSRSINIRYYPNAGTGNPGAVRGSGSGAEWENAQYSSHDHSIPTEPSHSHTIPASGTHEHVVNSGGGQAHNNLHPVIALPFILKIM